MNDHQICSTQRAFTKSDKTKQQHLRAKVGYLITYKVLSSYFFPFFGEGGGYLVHGEICIEIKLATNSPSEGYPNHTFP